MFYRVMRWLENIKVEHFQTFPENMVIFSEPETMVALFLFLENIRELNWYGSWFNQWFVLLLQSIKTDISCWISDDRAANSWVKYVLSLWCLD